MLTPKAAMRAAELLLQQGKTDAAMIQLAPSSR